MAHAGGRPRQLNTEDIIRVGRELGLAKLSLNAVAARLNVNATALYRHVANRWELEQLVGEDILADFHPVDDPQQNTVQHLVDLGLQFRAFILKNPGLAAYIQTLFPRGEAGRRLLAVEARALGRRGYSPEAAVVLSSAVASLAIGYAATEELQRTRGADLDVRRAEALTQILDDQELGAAQQKLPQISPDEYVRMWLGAAVSAFVHAAPPGRSIEEIRSALNELGSGKHG